jgi:2-polyprenyl-3-methyl-5-hydroxy-6-metoxy-1,4-benzoquinol methylase
VVGQAEATRTELRAVIEAARSTAEIGEYFRLTHEGVVNAQLGVGGQLRKEFADLGVDRWKVQELEGLLRYLRRRVYEDDVAAGRIAVPDLFTDHPVALDTDDTTHPRGAMNDNSICYRFNQKLPRLFPDRSRLAVLDLGCAGGGFVRSLIDDGHFAVGIDGSDTPRLLRLGEWGTIPHHLHTCDITKPFALRDRATGDPLRFDAITAWEVLEHIREDDLPGLMRNIADHLAPGGLFFCSVATFRDEVPELGAVYHHTVQPRDWWVPALARLGFEVVPQTVITDDDWVRGAGNCRYDYRAEAEGLGFHLVLRPLAQAAAA